MLKKMTPETKTILQCDFDGTITEEDVSFILLDRFAPPTWRDWLDSYRRGQITVGQFNKVAFSLMRAGRKELFEYVNQVARIRPGLKELVEYCRQHNIEFVVVSNGLDFYINAIFDNAGIPGSVRVIAASTEFDTDRVKVKYIGPDGNELMDKFKESYTRLFLDQGYRVIYAGNGVSDLPAARLSERIFACQDLAEACREHNIPFIPFNSLYDIVEGLKKGNQQ